MKRTVDLLTGNIFPSLTKLALPIMATSLVQMAYNMTDMIWIGRVSSNAVAAVGAAGMYMWLANGLTTLARMGGQVTTGQLLGAGNHSKAGECAQSALQMGLVFGVVYGILAMLFARPMIAFFRLNSPQVVKDAEIYLMITCGLIVFSFLNQILTGLFTAAGNSQTPFVATAAGLVINIVLDPVLIFGIGPFPRMEVAGAAIATVFAQAVVTLVFYIHVKKDEILFRYVHLLRGWHWDQWWTILKIGIPASIQSMMFTGISMVIARMIAGWGDAAVAVQKVGSQIESISWMTAEGFASAVNSFVAQNYGAGNQKRVKKGYWTAIKIELVWGLFCSAVLLLFPAVIFRVFLPQKEVLQMGVDYLRILGVSQLFMCIEITTTGAFSGMGKTLPPAIISAILTASRIPMAAVLSATVLGLNGIWWSISISSIIKGVVLVSMFTYVLVQLTKKDGMTYGK